MWSNLDDRRNEEETSYERWRLWKLKGEIVFLKKEVDLLNKNLKISQTLDDILSHQRYPLDKSGLGYVGESSSKNDNSSNKRMWGSLEEILMLPVLAKSGRRIKTTLEEILLTKTCRWCQEYKRKWISSKNPKEKIL